MAKHHDIATAARLYHRDYQDLASDRGGSCAGGIARPEDAILANRYLHESLVHQELQRRAQAQANAFRQVKETAQAQLQTLQQEQNAARSQLEQLNEQIVATQEEREKKQDDLAIAESRLDSITRLRNSTEQTFIQLVNIEQLNLAQASLELEIAQQRQAEIEEAVNARLERERIELARQRLEAQAKIEQLKQLQSEEELRQALNQARSDIGLKDLQGGDNPVQLQTQLAGLLAQLKDLEGQQPDLPANVKALLAEAKGDIHEALQGKEATTIQENLLKAMGGLIGQVQHHQSQLAELEFEAQWDKNLLAKTEQDLQGATQELLKEVERNQELQEALAAIDPLYTETLTKVAYANQAVDISQELAAQSRKLLEDVITQRVAERKARKKYFWNQMLGMVSSILSIVSMILLVIPPTTAIGAITAKVGLGVSLISGAINATQAAINGDFMGAIFSAVMAGASFVGGAIGNALQAGKQAILGMTKAVAQKVASTIKTMQALASGAYNSVRSFASGDSIMGFLNIVAGLASTATTGIAGFAKGGLQGLSDLGKFGYKVLDSLSKAPTAIYGGIKAIQSGDWVNGIGSIVKSVVSLANTWTNDFNDDYDSPGEKLANVLENISSIGIGISKFITGGFQGLLDGIGDIVEGLGDDIGKWLEEHLKPDQVCICIYSEDERLLKQQAEAIIDEIKKQVDDANLASQEREKLFIDTLIEQLQNENLDITLKARVIEQLGSIEEQAIVLEGITPKQQREIFRNFQPKTQEKWAKYYIYEQLEFDRRSKKILTESQNGIHEYYKDNNYAPDVVLKGVVIQNNDSTLDFIWGALQGEFNQNPSFGQIIVHSLIGMIPILGEAVDISDLIAYGKKFIDNPEEMKDPWNWVGVFGSLVGLVPVAGGAIKGTIKVLRNAAIEQALRRADSVGDIPSGGRGPLYGGPDKGKYSGRDFDKNDIGGIPIHNLSTDKVKITNAGINVVKKHTERFDFAQQNQLAIERLEKIAVGKIEATQEDLNFYTHELREYVRYRNIGYANGVPSDPNEATRIWNNLHTATLEDYRITGNKVYHQSTETND